MSFLLRYIRPYSRLFFTALAFLLLETFCDLTQPAIIARIIDVGITGKNIAYIFAAGAVMLGVTALGALGAVGRNILASNVSQKFGRDLRLDLFKKIQSFSFTDLQRFEAASLITRLTNDVTQVQNFFNGMMRIFVKAPILCVGSIIMAALVSKELVIILALIVPIVSLLIILAMKSSYPFFRKVQYSLDRINNVMREYLSGVRVVKAFNRFAYEEERFAKANQEQAELATRAMRVMVVFSPLISLAVNFGIIGVLLYGGYRVNAGDMHAGQIIAFINYMTQILFSLMMLSFIFNMFIRARASSERIGEVLEGHEQQSPPEPALSVTEVKGSVAFDKVSFSYPHAGGEPVLKEISFAVNPGELTGIIGPTGSGKSTLAGLIQRYYDPSSGVISIDGLDLKQLDPESIRGKMAVVPQKTFLFSGTILDNIRWGKEDATFAEVTAAAQAAQAHDFIDAFPEGYDTQLGQGGVTLSGGQKQRISLARALVRKPRILILDDCTSSVDAITEARIRESLRSWCGTTTCFIVAQRITAVMRLDNIIALDEGRIAGMGKHDALLKNCPVYRDIYESQIGKQPGKEPGVYGS